jgi:hypothetical protein
MVPRTVDNLLVPVAASSTHVGFCALRFEPVWMALGEASGYAVHLANRAHQPVQLVKVAELQRRLNAGSVATVYVSDVPPGHADFAAVQWWGTQGGLHGLSSADGAGREGDAAGRLTPAFPGHAVGLNEPLDAALIERWQRLLEEHFGARMEGQSFANGTTRGEWIRRAWRMFGNK